MPRGQPRTVRDMRLPGKMNFYHHNNCHLQKLQWFPIAEWYRFSRLALKAVHSPDPPSQPLLPETTSPAEFFSLQEHILPQPAPRLGPSEPGNESHSFIWLHLTPRVSLPSPSRLLQLFQPPLTSLLFHTRRAAWWVLGSAPLAERPQAPWFPEGIWSVTSRPLLAEMILFRCVSVGRRLLHHTSDSAHHTARLGEE
uniref:Uncharacterized protein n=1 Tax=Molossus molossus TaxID=27622 RepID=A0A7J8EEG1_MOLMO|nr:hypothetical protein HJG59_008847 [Molossus molossus]